MTKHTNPERFQVYTANDEIVSPVYPDAATARAAGKVAADTLGAIVYFIGDNGSEAVQPSPVVGMAATISVGTDRYAATIVSVSKAGSKVVAKYDHDGDTRTFYRDARSYISDRSWRLTVGIRQDYRCPEF